MYYGFDKLTRVIKFCQSPVDQSELPVFVIDHDLKGENKLSINQQEIKERRKS